MQNPISIVDQRRLSDGKGGERRGEIEERKKRNVGKRGETILIIYIERDCHIAPYEICENLLKANS